MSNASNKTSNARITVNGEEFTLNRKQELFCRYYVSNGLNGTQAAIKAGYSKKSAKLTAHKNITKAYLKAFIDKLQEPVLDKLKIDENWVITKLHTWSELSILDFFEQITVEEEDPETKLKTVSFSLKLKDLTTIPKEKMTGLEYLQEYEPGKWRYKLVNQRWCTLDVGKHLGMFTERFEGTVNQNIENKTLVFILPAVQKRNK